VGAWGPAPPPQTPKPQTPNPNPQSPKMTKKSKN